MKRKQFYPVIPRELWFSNNPRQLIAIVGTLARAAIVNGNIRYRLTPEGETTFVRDAWCLVTASLRGFANQCVFDRLEFARLCRFSDVREYHHHVHPCLLERALRVMDQLSEDFNWVTGNCRYSMYTPNYSDVIAQAHLIDEWTVDRYHPKNKNE